MTTLREAAQQALEALQKIYIAPEHEEYIRVWWPSCRDAIPTLRAALAQEKAQLTIDRASMYHPCTYILIQGLKKLNAHDVLAEWDKARAEVDALAPKQTEEIK